MAFTYPNSSSFSTSAFCERTYGWVEVSKEGEGLSATYVLLFRIVWHRVLDIAEADHLEARTTLHIIVQAWHARNRGQARVRRISTTWLAAHTYG